MIILYLSLSCWEKSNQRILFVHANLVCHAKCMYTKAELPALSTESRLAHVGHEERLCLCQPIEPNKYILNRKVSLHVLSIHSWKDIFCEVFKNFTLHLIYSAIIFSNNRSVHSYIFVHLWLWLNFKMTLFPYPLYSCTKKLRKTMMYDVTIGKDFHWQKHKKSMLLLMLM